MPNFISKNSTVIQVEESLHAYKGNAHLQSQPYRIQYNSTPISISNVQFTWITTTAETMEITESIADRNRLYFTHF